MSGEIKGIDTNTVFSWTKFIPHGFLTIIIVCLTINEEFYFINFLVMKKMRLGQGSAIFILFFGIAMLDAFKSGNWWQSLFWIAVGSIFLMADNLKKV